MSAIENYQRRWTGYMDFFMPESAKNTSMKSLNRHETDDDDKKEKKRQEEGCERHKKKRLFIQGRNTAKSLPKIKAKKALLFVI